MLSTCVIVGHVADDVEIVKTSNGNSLCYLTVETSRPFRNDDGSVTKDTFRVLLWKGIAEECKEQCEIGSLVVIRGRLQSNRYEKEDKVYYNYEIVGEKVTYES